MRLIFRINYFTHWGQELLVVGNIPELGNNDINRAANMHFSHDEEWYLELNIPNAKAKNLEYNYLLKDKNYGSCTKEWGVARKMSVPPKADTVLLVDAWNSVSAVENTFLTSPFVDVLLKPNFTPSKAKKCAGYTHHFSVKAPLLNKGEVVCIIGDCPELGEWSVASPVILSNDNYPLWTVDVDLSAVKHDVHYKYGVYNVESQQFVRFEDGADRIVPPADVRRGVVVTDTFVRMPSDTWHGAGVGIPVFSLRTHRSFGVGDFSDLHLMVDWASLVGLKLIQVLPLNDTIGTHTDADVLPYAAISAFALNPLFMDITRLPLGADDALRDEYIKLQPQLNSEERVDFLNVINFKLRYISASYRFSKAKFLADEGFKRFFEENRYWLKSYAVYCCLRDRFGSSDYSTWGDYVSFSEGMIDELSSTSHEWFDEVAQWWYCQYQLHLQLREAVEYAHSKGVVMKGDIPIGVNRCSVDTWVWPELFNMDMAAGAPPDMFAIKGQNWELPTYNWDAIAATDFLWWRKRFEQMARYFDTFRVDHILGFFRIWQIPRCHQEGIMGYLNPSIPLYVEEFEQRGLWFDYERFTKPYITDDILNSVFGEEADFVRSHCLYIEHGFAYRIRKEYSTQTEVQQRYEKGEFSERVKYGLFDLISNVLLFEKEGSEGRQYYPRFGMQKLSTYAALDERQKRVFDELYVDYFFRRQDERWYESGMAKLPALKAASNMLICGEDLGMMTNCVTRVMKELSILSLEIQRAPKTNKVEFFHPADAPYLSVVTPSTHDMSTIRGWWEEDHEVSQRFYNSQLGHPAGAPYFCEWWICRDILNQHLYSPAIWAIFQWQDLMSISPELRRQNPADERINVPSNSLYSWRYRMHIALEDLLAADDFNSTLRNYIKQSGR